MLGAPATSNAVPTTKGLPSQLVILSDTREKCPLLFPSHLVLLDPKYNGGYGKTLTMPLHVVRQTLKTGDYVLQGYERSVLIERKGSISELAKNIFNPDDRARFIRELVRLREECAHPIVLFEGSLKKLLTPTARVQTPGPVVDSLLRLLAEYRVEFHTFDPGTTPDGRRRMGELVARLLVAGAISHG